jgi:hypothetical protein
MRRLSLSISFLIILIFWNPLESQAQPQQFYVSPTGTPAGNGSINSPWDLATALAHPPTVTPGATIWLRGGVYQGTFFSTLNGAPGTPIIVRAYAGERVTLNAGLAQGVVLGIASSYTWFWGLEITTGSTQRVIGPSSTSLLAAGVSNAQVPGGGMGVKLINLIIHDTALGYGWWKEAVNSEIYGNVIYNNGWEMDDRGHGHAIYAQNLSPTMRISENIMANQYGEGITLYGSPTAPLNNFHVEGNVSFNNGAVSKHGYSRNLLLGGGSVAQHNTLANNYTYYPGQCCGTNGVGYSAGCADLRMTGNFFINHGDTALQMEACTPAVMTGNTFYGTTIGFSPAAYPGNTNVVNRPTTNQIFVRPNKYEPKRAHIIVYNWTLQSTVQVNIASTGIVVGETYTIRSAQNYYGKTITGTCNGGPIPIPMTGWGVAAPHGGTAAPSTLPEFGAFIITR